MFYCGCPLSHIDAAGDGTIFTVGGAVGVTVSIVDATTGVTRSTFDAAGDVTISAVGAAWEVAVPAVDATGGGPRSGARPGPVVTICCTIGGSVMRHGWQKGRGHESTQANPAVA